MTKHPCYYAGLYYIQEPSAMLPASRLPVRPGDLVLDLCAAPGGKATELSARLAGQGLLIANDVSASRAKALLRNLMVWGSPNCCVTGEMPERLLESFGCCFDAILVDAPCSGEGMFRRDSHLAEDWERRGPAYYSGLQREILAAAVEMLRPGGTLLYSTCTFSEEEDEDTVSWFLSRYPELSLMQPQSFEGACPGRQPLEQCLRVWPHRVKGEGHFLALMKKAETQPHRSLELTERAIAESHRNMPEEVRSFLSGMPSDLWKQYVYRQIGEQCLLVPPYELPGHLRYLRTGILAGTCRRGRFEPAQQLAMVPWASGYDNVFSMKSEDPRVIRYLKGETVELQPGEAVERNGWVLVCVDGFALGWGKYVNGSIRNKYYPGWRLQ